MADRLLLERAMSSLQRNREQRAAVEQQQHCVLLAGPGSGKTKTLTIAMARCLLEDVQKPRGIACITYNNECALELENRLAQLGIEPDERIFIGTVHSFALTHVIFPYARCVLPDMPPTLRVATPSECKEAVVNAYKSAIGGDENPHERWRFAERKRREQVDRSDPAWVGKNPELAKFIEGYEAELRRQGLIDFDDMPLLAAKMIREHEWIRRSLAAKFPVLFVDEYQDLGHALHELVQLLCFKGDVRLFAVGDPDQSIYAFTGANPSLLKGLAQRADVKPISLRFNYRSGTSIIEASKVALGEDRDYTAAEKAAEGVISFHPVAGSLSDQASFVIEQLLPKLREAGAQIENIAILYRDYRQGNELAQAAARARIPIVRADTRALVKRSSRLGRFIEACAKWAAGGWKDADPPFRRLLREATSLVFGATATREERMKLEEELITFLSQTRNPGLSTNAWLGGFEDDVLSRWRARSRTITEDWDTIDQLIARTDPTQRGEDLQLAHFGGRIEGSGRLNLSTFHSAKGREFDVVVVFGANNDILPNQFDVRKEEDLREARRLFYVGITRARKELHLVFGRGHYSPWVAEVYKRTKKS
jgi:DNA helicase-2/ATP-dependent DNA helicase PcrA